MRKKITPFEGKLHIKKGDTVVVLIGKDKGRTGEVTKVYPKTGRIIVAGLNMVTKHVKGQPTATDPNPESGRIEKEAPLTVSKVALVNAEGKPTRVRTQTDADGKKQRVAVKGGSVIANP